MMLKRSEAGDFPERRIRELPLSLANQIAAGEVVERPASVAKELIENSLDAAARWIDVDVEQGGVRLIRVRDDGSGIHRDDLAAALQRHATSKITSLADLEQVASLGFRGEALPSIASVSRLTLSSRCGSDDYGWSVTADGREGISAATPVAHPLGTTVEVRDLFFSTPARRKFLRSERTEQRQLQQIVKRLALSRFDVGFRLQCDGASMLRLPPAHNERARAQRLARICGTAFVQHALQIEFEIAGLKLMGWVAGADLSRGAADLQHLFVNGRWVRDSSATHAVRQAYAGSMRHDRYPACVLYIQIDARAVDVNVHPTKHEIRFRDRRLVHDFLSRSLARALAGASAGTAYTMMPAQRPEVQAVSDGSALAEGRPSAFGITTVGKLSGAVSQEVWRSPSPDFGGISPEHARAPGPPPMPPLGYALGQLKAGSYLLAENAQGLVLVDLRAALGRVVHRQLVQAYQAGFIPPRPLLVPVSLPVAPDELRAAEDSRMLLKKLGFELRCVGPEALSVRQIPSLVQGADLSKLIREVLSHLGARHPPDEDIPRAGGVLLAMATHAVAGIPPPRAVPEMNALLREVEAIDLASARNSSGSCWVQLSIDEITQLFRQDNVCGAAARWRAR
ncbi:MAG: DNA mismatch repair endonuclease MutL [Gammaproteobacteria bacterium]